MISIRFSATLCLRALQWARSMGLTIQATDAVWRGPSIEVPGMIALGCEMGLRIEAICDATTGRDCSNDYAKEGEPCRT